MSEVWYTREGRRAERGRKAQGMAQINRGAAARRGARSHLHGRVVVVVVVGQASHLRRCATAAAADAPNLLLLLRLLSVLHHRHTLGVPMRKRDAAGRAALPSDDHRGARVRARVKQQRDAGVVSVQAGDDERGRAVLVLAAVDIGAGAEEQLQRRVRGGRAARVSGRGGGEGEGAGGGPWRRLASTQLV